MTLLDAVSSLAASPEAPDWVCESAAGIHHLPPPLVDIATLTEAVAPYQWLLDRCGAEGLELTKTGRLRPLDVAAAMNDLGWSAWWYGKANREENTAPIRCLRETSQKLGLVRRYKGRLMVAPAGRATSGNPLLLWQHICTTLPLETEAADLAAAAALLLRGLSQRTGDWGQERHDEVAALAGFLIREDGEPLESWDISPLAQGTRDVYSILAGHDMRPLDPALQRALAIGVFAHQIEAASTPIPRPDLVRPVPCHVVKVTLREVTPPVWRRLRLPSDTPLPAVAEVVGSAMGWSGYHAWAFRQGQKYYALLDFDDFEDFAADCIRADQATLGQLVPSAGERAVFDYDFGDGWEHTIVVERIEEAPWQATVLAGRRSCPPEDVGGPYGYRDFLAAIADPSHPRHEELLEWIGGPFDPAAFDLAECDAAVKVLLKRR